MNTQGPQKLFVIDAMAMAFRNFHAFGARPLTTSAGLPVSAVFGSAMFLHKLIEDEKPDYLCIATDSKEATFRHSLYSEYKANRKDMPEDLVVQLPYLYRLFDALNIKVLKEPGLEADDLIGSLVKKYSGSSLNSFIVSGDKDFMQLINDHIFLYSPKKGEPPKIIGHEGVFEKFGCKPAQVIDVLALTGDSSDNVPGVPGIGDKTARQLITDFQSLDGIYQKIDQIKNPKQKDNLTKNKDLAYLSQKLVTIFCDATIHHDLPEIAYNVELSPDYQKLLELYQELEFRSLTEKIRKKILGENSNEISNPNATTDTYVDSSQTFQLETQTSTQQVGPKPKTPEQSGLYELRKDNPTGTYKVISSLTELNDLIETLRSEKYLSFDTETTGLDPIDSRPIGLSLSTIDHRAYYIPLDTHHNSEFELAPYQRSIQRIFDNAEQVRIAHNLKFDLQMLWNIGIFPKCTLADTMIAAYCCEATLREFGLDALCLQKFNFQKIPTSDLIGPKGLGSMLDVPLDKLGYYACEDADFCMRLWVYFETQLKEKNLERLFWNIEMPLVSILAKMEVDGVNLDIDALDEISNYLDKRAKELTSEIFAIAGEEFNINSPKQLGIILFEKLKIHEKLGILKIKKNKNGYSTDVSVLERLSEDPIAQKILDYRTCTKLKNTYVDILPQLLNQKTNRLHTHFHQTGTSTGRLSSSNPNLQNIPIRSDVGKQIRKAFTSPSSDTVIVSADYSQIELRLLAHIADEKELRSAFLQGADIHKATASKMFGIELEQVDSEQRSQAKAINFGIIYGMGAMRLARETGVSTAQAKEFIERYFATYPRIRVFMESALDSAKQLGYSITIMGRRRPIPELFSKDPLILANARNIAINSPIQGSAADLVKIAMIHVDKLIQTKYPSARMLLQVHDELVFECPLAVVENFKAEVKSAMEKAIELTVPLVVDIRHGKNWFEAH